MARFVYSKEEAKNLTTPLLTAITRGETEKAKKMIADEKYLEATDHYGDTPLMAAVQMKNLTIVQLLLDAGVDVHKQNNQRSSAFSFSILWNGKKSAITKLIIEHIKKLEREEPDSPGISMS